MRVALEEGCDGGIVPVYHYGNSQVVGGWPRSPRAIDSAFIHSVGISSSFDAKVVWPD